VRALKSKHGFLERELDQWAAPEQMELFG